LGGNDNHVWFCLSHRFAGHPREVCASTKRSVTEY
jgi:hypothetical protein